MLPGTEVETTAGRVPLYQNLVLSPDPHRLAIIQQDGVASVYTYRRPNTPWGVLVLPEFWLTMLSTTALLWSFWRDWHSMNARR